MITIVDTKHNNTHWVFYYGNPIEIENGNEKPAKFSVGVYSDENPLGAKTELEAIEIVKLNVPELEA